MWDEKLKQYVHIGDVPAKKFFSQLGNLRKNIKLSQKYFESLDPSRLYIPIEVYRSINRWINTWFRPGSTEAYYRLRKDAPRNRELVMTENEQIHVFMICVYVKDQMNVQLNSGVRTESIIEDIQEKGFSEQRFGERVDNATIFLFGSTEKKLEAHQEFELPELQRVVELFLQLKTESGEPFTFDNEELHAAFGPIKDFFLAEVADCIRDVLVGTKEESQAVLDFFSDKPVSQAPQKEPGKEAKPEETLVSPSTGKKTKSPLPTSGTAVPSPILEGLAPPPPSSISFDERLEMLRRLERHEEVRRMRNDTRRNTLSESQRTHVPSYALEGKGAVPLRFGISSPHTEATESTSEKGVFLNPEASSASSHEETSSEMVQKNQKEA